MWGARGAFLPAAAMVGYGCDGCWRRKSDRPTVGIVKIVYGSIFLYSYIIPIVSKRGNTLKSVKRAHNLSVSGEEEVRA